MHTRMVAVWLPSLHPCPVQDKVQCLWSTWAEGAAMAAGATALRSCSLGFAELSSFHERLVCESVQPKRYQRRFSVRAQATGADLPRLRVEKRKEEEEVGIWQRLSLQVTTAVAAGALLFLAPPVHATDALKTCTCLLKECKVELVRCIADPSCAANVACLQSCNNRPDETDCQIGCGDLFENSVVDEFNDCAVSRKGCVQQKQDEGLFPVPPPSALVPQFNIVDFSGDWYISSGLNPTFDIFDCQLHKFSASVDQITANLSWRISTPDGGFFTRSAVQQFVQDSKQPAVLYNHGNQFLHYQDDWYILSAKTKKEADDYIFVYYRGRNDAWDGYGGAVVYTRSKFLPESIVPELTSAANKAGLDFSKFKGTDNSCGPEPPLLTRLEKTLEKGEQALVKEALDIEEAVEEVGKNGLSPLLANIGKGIEELKKEEEQLAEALGEEEKILFDALQMEARDIENLFGKAIPLRKLR